jgi:N12 class adenine-specific DNA methylase
VAQTPFLTSPFEQLTETLDSNQYALPKAEPDSRKPASDNYMPPAEVKPIFETAAREFNVPVNVLMALGHQESRYNPNAIGPTTQWGRAKGLMQYLDSTAKGMGINPFDPNEAIPAAAKQIRERLDKGYSMEDAVKEHFAGPDRKLWGEKTNAYGREVMEKVGRIGAQFGGSSPAAQGSDIFATLNKEEPGRYRAPTAEELAVLDRVAAEEDAWNKNNAAQQKKADDRGFFDRAGEAVTGGYSNMLQSLDTAKFAVAGGDSAALAKSLATKFEAELGKRKTTGEKEIDQAFQNVTDAKGVWDTTKAGVKAVGTAFSNPKDLAVGIAEQAPNMLPTLAGGAGGAGTGAAIGAGVGATVAGVGAIPGAVSGAIWGSRAGMVAGTTATELGAEVEQMVLERLQSGKQAPTEQNIKTLLDDTTFQGEARERGLKKGLTVGIIDQIFLGLGGKVASKAIKASTTAGKVGLGAGAVALDAVGETTGEAASQLVARGEVDAGDALREGVYGLGQSIVEPAIGAGMKMAKGAVGGTNPTAPSAADVPPTAPPAAPAAPTVATVTPPPPSQAAGPLSRSLENTANQPARVTVEAPEGTISGFVQSHSEDAEGNSITRVLGDDGQIYNFTSADGVQIKPESGPLTKALQNAADQTPEVEAPVAAPVTPAPTPIAAKPVELSLEDMSEADLRARMKYIAGQAKANGGWDKKLTAERRKIEKQITKITQPSEAATNGINTAGLSVPDVGTPSVAPVTALQADQPRASTGSAAVNGSKPTAAGASNPGAGANVPATGGTADAKPALGKDLASANPRYAFGSKQFDLTFDSDIDRAAYIAAQATPSKRDAGYVKFVSESTGMTEAQVREHGAKVRDSIKAMAKDAEPGALTVATVYGQQPATEAKDEYAGKWFGSQEKAAAFLAKKNIAATHDVVQTGKVRFEIKPKGEANGINQRTVGQSNGAEEVVGQQAGQQAESDTQAATTQEVNADTVGVNTSVVERDEPKQETRDVAQTPEAQQAEEEGPQEPAVSAAKSGISEKSRKKLALRQTEDWWTSASKADRRALLSEFASPVVEANAPLAWSKMGSGMQERVFALVEAKIDPKVLKAADDARKEAIIDQGLADAERYENGVQQNKDPIVEAAAAKFANNKIFTQDAVEKARARMRSKLTQFNSGIDPEMLMDGITITGAYIESGVRTFSDYAKAMTDDFGDTIKPYLLSFYEAVRNYPNIDVEGMSSASDASAEHAALVAGMTPKAKEEVKEAIGTKAEAPAKRTKKTGAKTDLTLTQDWGVEAINGYSDDAERETGSDMKDAFLKETKAYLTAVAGLLTEKGYAAQADAKGRAMKPVSVNESGMASSGEASLTMYHPDGHGIYANIGSTSLRGMVPTTRSGISILFRAASEQDKYGTKSTNRWAPVDLSAADLASLLDQEAQKTTGNATRIAKMPTTAILQEGTADETRNANTNETPSGASNRALEGIPAAEVRSAEEGGDAQQRSPASSGADTGRPGNANRTGNTSGSSVGDGTRDVPVPVRGRGSKRGSSEQQRVQAELGIEQTDAGTLTETVAQQRSQEVATARQEPKAAGDYRITDLTRLGEGGQKTKYRNNVAAIRLLDDLQKSARTATPDEQDVLARYVGWGGIAQAFDPANTEWAAEYAELQALLSPEEWDAAKESTQYAHYTSQEIITGMYDALRQFGFSGGKVLEPGSGVGNFIGLMPEDMRSNSRFTAVERERIAGGVAKQLYPNQNVQAQDFRSFNAKDGYFDVVTGNPPFSSTTLTDLSGRKHLSGLSIHNYFFAKSVDMLREGGILQMVVSNSFLDAKGDKARRYIGERTELLGAIRLPNKAFAKNANTEVTTDIIFLKKRPEAEWGSKESKDGLRAWQSLGTVPDPLGGDPIPLNQYFIDNPSMMLGRMERSGSMYRGGQPALIARDGDNTAALMAQAIARLPKNAYVAPTTIANETIQNAEVVALDSDASVDVGGHYVKDGSVYVRMPDVAGEGRAMQVTANTKITEKRDLGANGLERLKQLAEMRVTVRNLLAAEIKDAGNIEPLRKTLNQQYDAYVKKNGLLNSRGTVQLFGDDPDFPLLASLENSYDPGIGDAAAKAQGIKPVAPSAKKATIFSRRVIEKHEEITQASSPADALVISIAERGKIDADYIGKLLDKNGAEVLDSLTKGDKPALFIDPATNGYVLRDQYLSGNVRKKLEQAKAAGMYQNVAELEKVIPEDIPAHEISGKIGAPWVPTEVYEDFASTIMGDGTNARVVYVPAMSSYVTTFTPGSDVENTNTYGTKRMGADEIYAALLNSKEIRVGHYEEDPATRSRRFVLEKDATDEANDKAREIKDKFNDWLFSDGDRAEKMQRAYNDAVNNYVTREFDGSMLKFPGKVPDEIIRLRRHQRNAVSRIIQDGRALLDHVVGAGKTFTIIAAAMELKRTGLANKPMIAVPNHLVKQWAADFYRLYPGANILTATKKDFQKQNRRKFLAKIATGNWDAVIIAHSSFGFIKPDQEFEMKFNAERIDEIVEAMEALAQEKDQNSKRTVKQLAKMKENLENKLASLRDRPMDDLLDFGQIGIDNVFVDEAHLFKNLMFVTKMQNVRGLGQPKGSQRAYDMFIKTHQIYEQNGNGRGVVFATGTPVSNSLAEMYHMLRYLAPETLKDSNQFTFDAWAKTFADVEQVWMQSMSGDGYKSSNRMSRFVNTPELLRAYDQVADTVTIDDIKQAFSKENNGAEFPIPKQKGGRRTPVSIPRSQAQNDYMTEIAKRAKELEKRKGKPQKGDDNMLSIMGDARKAAMDIRMVRPDINERDPNSRIALAANNIFERYQTYNNVRGTQLVFSDMGTPKKHAERELKEYNELMAQIAPLSDEKVLAMAELGDESAQDQLDKAEEAQRKVEAKGQDWLDAIKSAMRGFSIYDDLKEALVEKGIPENEVAFIHDYNTDDQKAALFRAVNDGKVRVVLGSTEKMGAGTNVQERAVALHHLDVPWKPSDIEQREGRVIRQGNRLLNEVSNFEVEVMAYATQDTLDLFMWQTQEKKLAMIGQLRTGNVGREVDNAFEEMQMSAGEMQAAATSNPYLLEEIQLKEKVKKLERQKRSFDGQKNDLANRKRRAEKDIESIPGEIKEATVIEKAAEKLTDDKDAHFDGLTATVNKEKITGSDDIRTAVRNAIEASPMVEKDGKQVREIKVEMNGKEYTSESGLAEAVNKALGDAGKVYYTLPDGKTVYRGADVVTGLIDPMANMIESQGEAALGKVGAFDVTGYYVSEGRFDVVVTLDGKEVGDMQARYDTREPGALNTRIRAIPGEVSRIIQSSIGLPSFLSSKLEKAKRTLADIDSKQDAGNWTGDAELTKAREDYRSVLKKLSETAEAKTEETDETKYSVAPDGTVTAEFGPVTEEFRSDPAGAIASLMKQKSGEAIVNHPTLGEISLVYGDGTMGLSHIAARRGDAFLKRIPALLEGGDIYGKENQDGRVFIGNNTNEATIRMDWNGEAKAWLVSAYEKYPDLSTVDAPRASTRSDTIKARSAGLNVDGLSKAISKGVLKPVIDALVENGVIVLHQTTKTLPNAAARTKRGVQAIVTPDGKVHLVAASLNAKNAQAVLWHEMFHNGGERFIGSEQWSSLMGRGASLYSQSEKSTGKNREFFDKARSRVAAAKRQGAVATNMEVEEFLAYAIEEYESAPASIRKWVDDVIAAIKAWLLKTYGKQIGQVTPAQLAAIAKMALMDVAADRRGEMFGRLGTAFSAEQDTFAAEVMAELAVHDEMFQYPVSNSTTLEGVMSDVDPALTVKGDVTAADERAESGADRKMMLRTPTGKTFYVYERGNKIWLDVSQVPEGEGGNRIYAAVANYAYNTGKVFTGDPAGLSDTALRRRTENMLSSAIKFGTTRHLEPHQRQLDGDKALGVPALDWQAGNDVANISAMIETSLESLAHYVPDFKTASYDFATNSFLTGEGKPLSDSAIDVWASSAGRGRASGAGRTSLKRAVVLNTLVRSESSERPGLLESVLRQPSNVVSPALRGVMYSVTPERAENILDEAEAALEAKAKDDYIGSVIGDMSLGARLIVHPRTVAAVHKEFTPVYRTAISQMETRDKNIAEFGADVSAYDALEQAGKDNVNRVLELGRLTSTVYTAEELANGVANTGEKNVVVVVDGRPQVSVEPVTALLTGIGEVVKLSDEEIKAYRDLRNMFDNALSRMRDQTLSEMGFEQFVGAKNAAKEIMATIDANTPADKAERLRNIAAFVREIEQAKRAGYVPFARYGDYVVTVKEKIADVKFVYDGIGKLIAQGLPDSFTRDMLELGAVKGEEGWSIKDSQRRDVERLTEKTIYSTKVETGLRDLIDEKRAGKVDDIPAVKDAIEKARAEVVGDNPNRRIMAFKVSEKKSDQPVKLSDVDALAEVASIDNATWDAIRDKLADAIKSKGFRSHFFHSDNVPGYTGDFERSIADYVIGMSGYLSRREHMKRWENSVSAIKNKPKLFAYASKYRNYVNDPQEELAMVRQIGFFSYIAGVVASAFANLTQVPLMAVPTLAQVAPVALVSKEVARAYKDATMMLSTSVGLDMFDPEKAPEDVRGILKEAWAEGSFVPLETFDLMMTARQRNVGARKGVKAFNSATQVISLSFTFAERMNRLVTFIAAARLAQKRAVHENAKSVLKNDALARAEVLNNWNPKSFAEWAVDESQYRMGKANRPTMMRGVGSAIMQFKGFMLQTFEAWYRMSALHGRKGQLMAASSILSIAALSGIWGLPGADDLRKLLENIYKQISDKDLDLKTELRAWIARTSGSNAVAQIVSKGATYPLGIDLTRVGMGTVAPDSPLAAAGIPFDMLIGRPKRAFEKGSTGDYLGAVGELTPNFMKHWLVSGSWALEGVRDKRGNLILKPEDLGSDDLVKKALGFQPSIITDIRDYEYAQRRQETAMDNFKRGYVNKLAKAFSELETASDPAKVQAIDDRISKLYGDIDEHNAKANPEDIIKIDQRTLRGKIMREREGIKGTWGKERKNSRGAAEELRGVFGLSNQEDD